MIKSLLALATVA
jgi:lysosomal acid lipase/cholesteryl ester hydrolase